MKGQYLAIEAVLTFGMGLLLAIATISAFNSYNQNLLSSGADQQMSAAASQLKEQLLHLKQADTADTTVDLPEEIGGNEYLIALDNGITLFLNGETYNYEIRGLDDYNLEGSSEGGEVNILKRENEIILGAN